MDNLWGRLRALVKRVDRFTRVDARPFFAILLLVTAGFFAWLIVDNWAEIRVYLRDPDLSSLGWTVAGYASSILTATFGWSLIMGPLAPDLRRRLHIRIYALTLVARRLPGSLWYVGGRMVLYRNRGVPGSYTAFASALELAIIILTGLVLGLAFLPDQGDAELFGWVVIPVGILFVWFSPRIIQRLSAGRGVELQRPVPWYLPLGWIAAFLATWAGGGVLVYGVTGTFTEVDASWFPYILGSWGFSGALGSLTIFLPSTFGVAEISLSLLLSRIVPLPLAGVIAITTRLLTTVYDLALALIFYPFLRQIREQALHSDDPQSPIAD